MTKAYELKIYGESKRFIEGGWYTRSELEKISQSMRRAEELNKKLSQSMFKKLTQTEGSSK